METTTRKVRDLFLADMQTAADTGRTGPVLWTACYCLCLYLAASVWPNEGYNALLKRIQKQCQHISQPLLDARGRIKKTLGVGADGRRRWNDVKERAKKLLDSVLAHHSEGLARLRKLDRWMPPPSAEWFVDPDVEPAEPDVDDAEPPAPGPTLGSQARCPL
jgi:hypothetical protein